MNFPIFVEADNGHFTASLGGRPLLSVAGATRDQAISTLKNEIQRQVEQGQLLSLEIGAIGFQTWQVSTAMTQRYAKFANRLINYAMPRTSHDSV